MSKKLERLNALRDDVASKMSANSQDFVNDYSISCSSYLGDLFHEFADNNTSIYYSDQKKFYFENEDECLEALEEFGYTGETLGDLLKDCGGLEELICKAGAIGEYSHIYNELSQNETDILAVFLLDYVISNYSLFSNYTYEEITHCIKEIINEYNTEDLDQLEDDLMELLKSESEEER